MCYVTSSLFASIYLREFESGLTVANFRFEYSLKMSGGTDLMRSQSNINEEKTIRHLTEFGMSHSLLSLIHVAF